MDIDYRSKIKSLFQAWQPGMIATYAWLEPYGITHQHVEGYLRSGWLTKISTGAFVKLGDKPTWAGAINALQQQAKLPIHIGGKTVIELRGKGHYIRSKLAIHLLGDINIKLPVWFTKLHLDNVVFTYNTTRLFAGSDVGLTTQEMDGFTLTCSSLERAIVELLAFIPQHYDYHEAAHLMESLRMLRPAMLQNVLEHCGSIKAKRLFLHLATLCKLKCLEDIDRAKIELGYGSRRLPGGTCFDKQFQIYVPSTQLNEGYTDDEVRQHFL
jgi:hypothetical protein